MHPKFTHRKISALALLLVMLLFTGLAPVSAGGGVIGDPAVSQPPAPGAAPAYQPDFTGCTRVNVAVQNAAYEQRVVELVNQERANVGVAPLKRNTDLDYAARYHAKDMVDDDYFAHNSYDRQAGTLVQICLWYTRVGYFFPAVQSENIAAGYYTTPESAMDLWMNSKEGHRENILDPGHREIGVGYYSGTPSEWGRYWVQDFGARSGVYPLIINNEAAQTSTPEVSLYIYSPSTTGVEMRLRNDNDDWGAWQPYQARINGTLKKINGVRTVSVELRSGTTTYAASDTIEAVNLALTPELGSLPDQVQFIYDQSQARLSPAQFTLTPLNTGSSDPLAWQASAADVWLSPQSGSGSTPAGTFSF
nr:CAP domain-containing protein [Anaerolinea sp.]